MNFEIVAEYTEVVGKRFRGADVPLPMLEAALEVARKTNCALIVASVHQLSLHLTYGWGFMIKGVPVMVAALGQESASLLLKLAATPSPDEATNGSEHVALLIAQEQSKRLKTKQPTGEAGHDSDGDTPTADEFAQSLAPDIQALRERGINSARAIACEFNASMIKTRRGGTWSGTKVTVLLNRLRYLTRRGTLICLCCTALADQLLAIT